MKLPGMADIYWKRGDDDYYFKCTFCGKEFSRSRDNIHTCVGGKPRTYDRTSVTGDIWGWRKESEDKINVLEERVATVEEKNAILEQKVSALESTIDHIYMQLRQI
jgi:hypothetical protein